MPTFKRKEGEVRGRGGGGDECKIAGTRSNNR